MELAFTSTETPISTYISTDGNLNHLIKNSRKWTDFELPFKKIMFRSFVIPFALTIARSSDSILRGRQIL
jgi:hypothetical protein